MTMAPEQECASITCPHLITHPGKDGREPQTHYCGIDEHGRGRRTRLPVPFWCFDGEDFIVACPVCHRDVVVKARNLASVEEAV